MGLLHFASEEDENRIYLALRRRITLFTLVHLQFDARVRRMTMHEHGKRFDE